MAEVPRGTRSPEDEPLFKQPTEDPTVQPDTVTPAVEGYFRIPPVWIGDKPDDESVLKLDPQVHHARVFTKDMRSGIGVRVQRDGTFLFDFSSWQPAPQIVIPGYRTPGPGVSHRAPTDSENASQESERYAVLRAQLMNVHQACLATSQWISNQSSSGIGLPLTAADTLKGLTFEECIIYRRNEASDRLLVRNVVNNHDGLALENPYPRHVVDNDVIAHSFDLLDEILLAENTALIQMVEAAYLAACRYAEGRLGEAITLAWGVCEQLLSSAWHAFLEDARVASRMPRERTRKLVGRDYTASVVTEMLELGMRIDYELYRQLEKARKARNRWAHEMSEPDHEQVRHTIRATEGLFLSIHDLPLSFPLNSPSPGVPAWNIWVWEGIRRNSEL